MTTCQFMVQLGRYCYYNTSVPTCHRKFSLALLMLLRLKYQALLHCISSIIYYRLCMWISVSIFFFNFEKKKRKEKKKKNVCLVCSNKVGQVLCGTGLANLFTRSGIPQQKWSQVTVCSYKFHSGHINYVCLKVQVCKRCRALMANKI